LSSSCPAESNKQKGRPHHREPEKRKDIQKEKESINLKEQVGQKITIINKGATGLWEGGVNKKRNTTTETLKKVRYALRIAKGEKLNQ